MKKLSYKKQDITKIIQILKEQDNEDQDNTVVIKPEELYRILPAIDYNLKALSKLKKYKDKQIIIDGNLNLSEKPVKSLGPIVKILGNLDISYTDIASIEGVTVIGHTSDWGSERSKIRERKRIAGLRAEAQSKREDDEWAIEKGDPEGLAAQAIMQKLRDDGEDVQSEEDIENLRGLNERLGNLYYDQEQGDDSDELQEQIDKIEADIEEIEEKIDVYELIPQTYGFYGKFYRFEVISGDLDGREYAAGPESDIEEAALEYAKEFIDEVGFEGFNRGFLQDHLDTDGIIDYFRDFYENDIRDNPEVYFSDDDYELTDEQEKRKEQLEEYIEEMENLKSETEDEQRDLEDYDSDEYYELDEKIKEIESNIETAQDELDSIEPDTEPTDEMIENTLEDILRDVKYDPIGKLNDFDMDINDWVNKDDLAQGLVDSDGYGIMNPYDGSYDNVYVGNTEYIVMRLN